MSWSITFSTSREGLKNLIDRSSDYQVVGEASNAEEALDFIRKTRTDLITMDLSLPDMSGIEVIKRIKDLMPHLPILVVSMHSEFEYVQEAFLAGANGYLVKDATGEKLITAMDAIGREEYFLDGNASQEVVAKLLSARSKPSGTDRYGLLSPREQEVFRLVVEGLSNKDIGEELSISPKTVDNHRSNLMKKMDIHNRLDLVRYAVKIGLVDVEKW